MSKNNSNELILEGDYFVAVDLYDMGTDKLFVCQFLYWGYGGTCVRIRTHEGQEFFSAPDAVRVVRKIRRREAKRYMEVA